MRVLFVSSEAYPLAKTGGLADVSAALPRALAELGVDVRLVLPGYPCALDAAAHKIVEAELPRAAGADTTRLIRAFMPDSGLPVWLVDCPALFNRRGGLYQDDHGADWPDNAQRFAHFSAVTAQLALGKLVPDWQAGLVHANDWHAGLLPILLGPAREQRPASIFTIHNLAYQGLFPSEVLQSLALPDGIFTPDGIEFYGKVSFLKAGIRFSDHVTTVSPSYAREILTPEFGCGLDGLLRHRMKLLTGILNGVDYRVWNPTSDRCLPARFGVDDLSGKRICKADLQRELGLSVSQTIPLISWVSRITDQKMADVVSHALPAILERDVQLVMLGQGDPGLEVQLADAAQHYPGRLAVRIGFDEELAHRFHAGADLLLHPCRFEPCGLTPLYAMRYGTLPIVRQVGGLADTIIDATEWSVRAGHATGFVFREPSASAMLDCLDRALAFYAQPVLLRKMQRRAMDREFGWDASARRYLALYRRLAPYAAPAHRNPECDEIVQAGGMRSL
jgi:starch synthase